MPDKNFRLILCDLGNVLINFDHRIAVRRILPFTDKKFPEIYQIFFNSTFTRDFEEGRLSPSAFFARLKKELKLHHLDRKSFARIWNDIFFENEEVTAILKKLKKNYALHLVSNVNEWHFRYIRQKFPEPLKVFDRVFLSYEIGHCKPHASFFTKAVKESGFDFNETIYTDDREDLIEEAKKMGLTAILFKNPADFIKELRKHGVRV